MAKPAGIPNNEPILTASDIVGREAEVGELLSAMQSARTGRGTIHSIAAAPGMGKTSILQAFMARARLEPHARVLYCAFPVASLPLKRLRAMLVGAGYAPADGVTADAIVGSIAREAARSPIALLLDDAQWADEASLDVISNLAARVSTLPIAMVVAFRPRDRNEAPAFRGVLRELESVPSHVRLAAARLPDRDIRSIAQAAAGEIVAPGRLAEIVKRADGNPYFAKELARATPGRGLAGSLRTALRANLRGFSVAERSMLATAALLDVDCDYDLLARVSELTPQRCARLLEPALERGIVQEIDGVVTFGHALMREVAIESIPLAARVTMDARAIDAFDGRDDDDAVAARARHAWRSNDPRRFDLAALAAARFESVAPQMAAQLYEDALANPHLGAPEFLDLCAPAMRCSTNSGDFERLRRIGDRRIVELERIGQREEALIARIRLTTTLESNLNGPAKARAALEPFREPSRAFARAHAAFLVSASVVATNVGDIQDANALLGEVTPEVTALLTATQVWHAERSRILISAFEGNARRFEERARAGSSIIKAAHASEDQWFALSSFALEALNLGLLDAAHRWATDAFAGARGEGARAATGALLSRVQRLRGEVALAAQTVEGMVVPLLSIHDAPAAAIHAAAWRGDTLTIARYLDAARLTHIERSGDESNFATYAGAYIAAYASWADTRRARALAARLVTVVTNAHGCAEGLYLAGRHGTGETASRALALLEKTAARGEHAMERAFAALLRGDQHAANAFDALGIPYYGNGSLTSEGPNVPQGDLTARERVVADLLADNFRNAEIARVLGVSLETVYTHVSSVLVKLGVASRRDVRAARE